MCGEVLKACADHLSHKTRLYPTLPVIDHHDAGTPPQKTAKVSLLYGTYMPYHYMLQKAVFTTSKLHTLLTLTRANWCTKDDTAIVLHTAQSHLEHLENYTRILFIKYDSDFYPIIMDILVSKLHELGLNLLSSSWTKDFFTNRPQTVKRCPYFSFTHLLSTGSLQGCRLSPLPFAFYTNDCSQAQPKNTIIKFTDDNMVVGHFRGK